MHRSAYFAAAVRFAGTPAGADASNGRAVEPALLETMDLLPPASAALAEWTGAAYALGWVHPTSAAVALPAHPASRGDATAVDIAVVLGTIRRVDDVTAAALFADPRGEQPCNQMLAARLADHIGTATVFTAALDRYADGDRDDATMCGVLALVQECAVAACDTALMATPAEATRIQIEQRRAWLTHRFGERSPIVLLDAVAAVIVGAPA